MSFNPRAHAGRDTVLTTYRINQKGVSIHAPMQGATQAGGIKLNPLQVSIHAPMQGATIIKIFNITEKVSFNPRAHAGRDRRKRSRGRITRGFNPRAHAGRDGGDRFGPESCKGFQSTRPCRARPIGASGVLNE